MESKIQPQRKEKKKKKKGKEKETNMEWMKFESFKDYQMEKNGISTPPSPFLVAQLKRFNHIIRTQIKISGEKRSELNPGEKDQKMTMNWNVPYSTPFLPSELESRVTELFMYTPSFPKYSRNKCF